MKIAVIVFPGSNCDLDIYEALHTVCQADVEYVPHKATSLARFAPVMKEVIRLAKEGKPVFGTCNGFQILTEAGLLPGALKRNDSQQFVCKTVPLEVVNNQTIFTKQYEAHERINLPIAHADGSYYADQATLDALEANHQVVFRYAEENPNGSLNNIAGITNQAGNVLGMMPHPERAVEAILGNTDGLRLFKSLLTYGTVKA